MADNVEYMDVDKPTHAGATNSTTTTNYLDSQPEILQYLCTSCGSKNPYKARLDQCVHCGGRTFLKERRGKLQFDCL